LFFGGFDYYNNNDNNIIINKQSLISELSKYRNIKLVIKSLEQKQTQLANNIIELENQKLILENYLNLLSTIIPTLGNLQSFIKNTNTLLQNPKIILIYFFFNSSKDNEKNSNEFDDSTKDNK